MQSYQSNTFMRPDTMLGVCEALGQDLGFNANYLRVPMGVLLLWNPTIVVATYLGLGIIVAFTRLLYPNPRRARPAAELPAEQPAATSGPIAADREAEPLAAAA